MVIKFRPVFYPPGKPCGGSSPSFSRARGIGIQLRPGRLGSEPPSAFATSGFIAGKSSVNGLSIAFLEQVLSEDPLFFLQDLGILFDHFPDHGSLQAPGIDQMTDGLLPSGFDDLLQPCIGSFFIPLSTLAGRKINNGKG